MKQELTDQWVAVQVRSRSEQMVVTLLRYKGYHTWLPWVPKAPGRSRQARLEPLFPGYIFCQLAEATQGLVVTTPGVLRLVGPGGRPEPVVPAEITAIQAVLASGLPARPAPMQPGCPVEVIGGPLKGCSGTVLEWKDRGLLLVGISLLQRAVSVVVETDWLRPVAHKPALSATVGQYSPAMQSAHVLGAAANTPVRPEWRACS